LGFQLYAVESPTNLPVIVEREDCMETFTRSRLNAEGRDACARALGEVVSLVAASDAGWFESAPRWPLYRDSGKFAEWLVHRKLLWRRDKLRSTWRRDKLRATADAAGPGSDAHGDGDSPSDAHADASPGGGPAAPRKRTWAAALAVHYCSVSQKRFQRGPLPALRSGPSRRDSTA
jgi:hypothetical protein